MYKVVYPNKGKTDNAVYIKHSYSVKGVKKKLIVEKYESTNELDRLYGSWETFIAERLLLQERESGKVRYP